MDNQKKVKKIEIVLCVLGALLLLFSGYYIVSPYLSKNNKQEIDNA